MTTLYRAAEGGHLTIVEFLVDNGSDFLAVTYSGNLAVDENVSTG